MLMCVENESGIPGLAQQDATPIIDELGDVESPVDLGNLTEHRLEQFVKYNFPVEPHHEVMNISSRAQVVIMIRSWLRWIH